VTPDAKPEGNERSTRWFLNDEREFFVRSLEDAEREHDAGDLSDDDYAVLVARDRQKLADVEAALAELGPTAGENETPPESEVAPATRSRRAEWRRVGIIACCFLIVAGVVILVDHAVQPSTPGQPSSGSITISQQELIAQQISEATGFNDENQDLAALQLFEKVLQEDPTNAEALAEAGWLQWKSGFQQHNVAVTNVGRANVVKSIRVAPTAYRGHLYDGLILMFEDVNYKAAAVQFTEFLTDHPPKTDLELVASDVALAYTKAGEPIPLAVSAAQAATSTTTTTPSKSTTTTSTP
jgi:hypothetical protein